jgi:virulence-associated protein VagC
VIVIEPHEDEKKDVFDWGYSLSENFMEREDIETEVFKYAIGQALFKFCQ